MKGARGFYFVDYQRIQKELEKFADCPNSYFSSSEIKNIFHIPSYTLSNWFRTQGLPYIKAENKKIRLVKLKDLSDFVSKRAKEQQKKYFQENKIILAS